MARLFQEEGDRDIGRCCRAPYHPIRAVHSTGHVNRARVATLGQNPF
jgi:hypothetical protein